MSTTEELKVTTAETHQATEKKMVGILKSLRNMTDYVNLLNRLHGFYAPVESLICRHLDSANFPDIGRRRRSDYLLWDIGETGLVAPQPRVCPELPRIDSYQRALGALYVLEGSTLGGQIIAGRISKELQTEKSLSFFGAYGAETRRMWQSFKDFINRPFHFIYRSEIIGAAKDTFITFSNWIDKHER